MKRSTLVFICYIVASILLFFYSFTQIDPNLTISRFGLLQVIQGIFQNVGMTQRPLSTFFYVAQLTILFSLYAWTLSLIKRGVVDMRLLWRIIIFTACILLFSYPAFSYDIYNYMFTAKTVLVYHQNPYEVIPLQFAGIDAWTNFMRWTHLPSAYTPFWIVLSLPAYILGFGFFLTTLWNIKLLVLLFHILTIIGIGKILEKVEPNRKVLGMAIYALNPLIIVENLVSAHNDVVMMAFAVWAIVFMLERKKLLSWMFISLSVAAKLITGAILPVWFFINKKDINWRTWMFISMIGGLLAVISTREVLPWYWVWIVPFIAIVPSMKQLTIISTGVSLGLLLRYAPYLYLGNWDPPALLYKNVGTWVPIIISILILFFTKKPAHRP